MGVIPRSVQMRWNENTVSFPVYPAKVLTVDEGSDIFVNPTARGMLLIVTLGTLTGTPTYRPSLRTYRADLATLFALWTAAAVLNSAGTFFYTIYPGGIPGGVETESVDIALPRLWQVYLDYTGTPVSDYCSVSAEAAYLI